ncbi:MAG TPA: hypothetical protein VGO07_01925 [Candidatus Saccharimonadales bacterium]|jgi:hypothetical protein|nr:hypothetical protein [Candidatus Saccharimonadales bacterium]
MFMDSAMRARNRFIDRSFEDAGAVLANATVQKHLGAYAVDLQSVHDRLYVPDVRDNTVYIPRRYRSTDAIPIVTARPGTPIVLSTDFDRFSPAQRMAARDATPFWPGSDPARVANNLEESLAEGRAALPPGVFYQAPWSAGFVAGTGVLLGLSTPYGPNGENVVGVSARPILVLNDAAFMSGTPPSSLIHEYEHIVQVEGCVVRAAANDEVRAAGAASRELEAAHVGALVSHGMREAGMSGDAGQTVQIDIDNIRAQVNGNGGIDAFRYDAGLSLRLEMAGLLQGVVQPQPA